MKKLIKLFSVIIVMLFISCSSMFNSNQVEIKDGYLGCPEGFECYAEILKNKSIEIISDKSELDDIDLVDNDSYSVIKYVYKQKGESDLGSSYQENVYFQIDNSKKEIMQMDKDLIKHNMLIEKTCSDCNVSNFERLEKGYLYVVQIKDQYQIFFDITPSQDYNIKKVKTIINGNGTEYGFSYIE